MPVVLHVGKTVAMSHVSHNATVIIRGQTCIMGGNQHLQVPGEGDPDRPIPANAQTQQLAQRCNAWGKLADRRHFNREVLQTG